MSIIRAADLFCGAGGTSTGLYRAAEELGRDVDLLAVNHWNVAIATHSVNHREAVHLCETLDGVDPRRVIAKRHLHLLVASPECTHHSNARGGRPMSDQSRASGWHVVRWAEAIRIDNILIENVREFLSWGPLGADGRPLERRRGETFRAWVAALESLNYRVEYRTLNAADYGDPTTRIRLFVIAKLGRRRVHWPEPTHAQDQAGGLPTWRSARDHVIDWSDEGTSIFNRKKPLTPRTINRIAAGMWKFSGLDLRDFLSGFVVKLYGTGTAASVDGPLGAVTAKGGHLGIATPFIIPQTSTGAPRSTKKPVPTLTTTSRGVGLAQPFILPKLGRYGRNKPRSVDGPTQAVVPHHGLGNLVTPFVIGQQSGAVPRSTEKPLPTVAQGGAISKVQPCLIEYYGTSDAASVDKPVPTVPGKSKHGIAQPFLVATFGERPGQEPRTHDVDKPVPAVTQRGAGDLVQPMTLSAGGPACDARPATKPLSTVLAKGHIGVADPVILDVNHGEDGKTGKPEGRTQSVHAPLRAVTGTRGKAVASTHLIAHGPEPVRVGRHVAHAMIVVVELNGKPHRALHLVFDTGEELTIDIRFRMLKPRELARAQGFPDEYQFKGDTQEDIVRQIGNAVPVNLARALCKAVLS